MQGRDLRAPAAPVGRDRARRCPCPSNGAGDCCRQRSVLRRPDSHSELPIPSDQIDFGPLSGVHAGEVNALHRRVLAAAPAGHLAVRSEEEIRAILADGQNTASVGAWSQGRLVAYALSSPQTGEEFLGNGSPLLTHIRRQGEPIIVVRGYAVDPDFKGHRIGFALIAHRKALAAARGLNHFVSLGATDNLSSFNAAVRSGSWLIGLERDRYCLNFLTYAGPLTQDLMVRDEVHTPVNRLDILQMQLEAGWVGTVLEDYYSDNGAVMKMRRLCDQPVMQVDGAPARKSANGSGTR